VQQLWQCAELSLSCVLILLPCCGLQERERAALIAAVEEEERQRLRAEKAAEADRRAGIDRRLAGMSAAEKRAIERREREKKEAERRK